MSAARWLAVPVAIAALALRAGSVSAQDEKGGEPAPPPVASSWPSRAERVPVKYTIDAEYVETGFGDGVRIVGDETIFWTNVSQEPVKLVYLHTYANAFRNTRSTFLREALRDGAELPKDMKFADMAMPRVSAYGDELATQWVSPDDGNADDRTVVRVDLRDAVEPGATLQLEIRFTLEMPRVFRRMGAHNGFLMAAQWYPKLGMYVGRDSTMKNVRDGWYCHQYHANTEFAADFADYDVTLRFPAGLKVGATGHPQGEDVIEEKAGVRTARRRYKAESVVDFAWTASRRFIEREYDVTPIRPETLDDPVSAEWRRRKAQLALPDADVALPTVKVIVLVQPEHADQADRMAEAARVALGSFGTWLGPYPYGRLTIVDPPWASSGAGGMEYPMLVTAGTSLGSPAASQRPEGVTVHEIGHQWLMGLLANNEAEEAWLDEGINTYLTALAMDLAYGPASQFTEVLGVHYPGVQIHEFPGLAAGWPEALGLPKWARPPSIEAFRLWCDLPPLSQVPARRYATDPMLPLRRSWLRRAGYDGMVKSGWTFFDRTSYAVNAYSRPALFLNTLRRSLGAEFGEDEGDRRFFRALRSYAKQFRFKHPTTGDFLRTFKEEAADPGPAADQLVRAATTLDYSVESIRSGDDPELTGFDDKGVLKKAREKDESAADGTGKAKTSIVRVRRRGEAVVPIDVEVVREGGRVERARWEAKDQAQERWRDFKFDGKVVVARVDPGSVYLQDGNRCDNAHAVDANARPAVKWSVRFLGWLENALCSYGRFF